MRQRRFDANLLLTLSLSKGEERRKQVRWTRESDERHELGRAAGRGALSEVTRHRFRLVVRFQRLHFFVAQFQRHRRDGVFQMLGL